MPNVITVVGARPQFIKAAALSRTLALEGIKEQIVHTGQHFDFQMSEVFFRELGIPEPNHNLEIQGGTHGVMTGRMLEKIESVLLDVKPELVLVYGDTNSTLAGALAASKLHIPIAHVEAGLRSWNRKMPEEINRILTDHVSSLLFCSSILSQQNLVREGVIEGVHVVGDVMHDAHRLATEVVTRDIAKYRINPLGEDFEGDFGLLTLHRAESTGCVELIQEIFSAIGRIRLPIIFPVHPRTRKVIDNLCLEIPKNLVLSAPVSYLEMIALLCEAKLVLTDSGGLQKEAYWAGKPCITLREETEWLETVNEGWNKLATRKLIPQLDLLVEEAVSALPETPPDAYGDAFAADRIAAMLKTWK